MCTAVQKKKTTFAVILLFNAVMCTFSFSLLLNCTTSLCPDVHTCSFRSVGYSDCVMDRFVLTLIRNDAFRLLLTVT